MTLIDRPTTPAIARLLDELDTLRPRLLAAGDLMWTRTADWVKAQQPTNGERGGGSSAPSDDDLFDRLGDHQASRYHSEIRGLIDRMLADAERLNRLTQITVPKQPRQIQGREMLDAQIAAAGWCVSCWRYNQTEKQRETDGKDHHYDKQACNRCAGFKREHGIYPPVKLLEMWHGRGKNWTAQFVERALAEAKEKRWG